MNLKKNDWLLLSSVALYSYLFYLQSAGINFLLFTLFLIGCLLTRNVGALRNWGWLLAAVGSLVSAVCVAYYGNTLSLWANIISLSLLSGFSFNSRSSLLFTLFFSVYSYVTAIVYMVLDYLERKKKQVAEHSNPFYVRVLLFGLPFLIATLFFFMYRAANPLFYNLTRNFTLNFVSWGWISFTTGGLVLLYGFYYPRSIPEIAIADQMAPDTIYPNPDKPLGMWGKTWNLDQELTTGVILLVLLNLLLFLVNALDINYLFFAQALPAGITYAESVHQGIGMLICSILIAILIILFYFRAHLNFYDKNKNLKFLAYLWVIQNAVLLISTAYRNQFYIQEYSLTYKRIGVYVYLLLAFIGLVTTFIKVMQAKSNWFLFRKNAWAAYFVLVLACAFNWDLLITHFNIAQAQTRDKALDKDYLLSLSDTNIPDLLELEDDRITPAFAEENIDPDLPKIVSDYMDYEPFRFSQDLHAELYTFLTEAPTRSWRSWNYDWARVKNDLEHLSQKNKITNLDLSDKSYASLAPLASLTNLYSLNLSRNQMQHLKQLESLKKLAYLSLSRNHLQTIRNFPALPALKELDLSQNKFKNLAPLAKAPNLERLNLTDNAIQTIYSLPVLPRLKQINLSGNTINDLSPLKKYTQLEDLKLSHSLNQPNVALPVISTINKLDISNNSISHYNGKLFENLAQFENLKSLDLSQNYLEYVKVKNIPSTAVTATTPANLPEFPLPVLPKLEVLILTRNNLNNLNGIDAYPALTNLYLGNNQVKDLGPITALQNLQVLDLQHNPLTTIAPLDQLPNLRALNLAQTEQALLMKTFPDLKHLVTLNLSQNNLSSLQLLGKLSSLEKLDLSRNLLNDLTPLSNLKKLKYLDLRENKIINYKPLYKLINLRILLIDTLTESDLAALKEKLPNTKIISGHLGEYTATEISPYNE